jgi:hypothetical protein
MKLSMTQHEAFMNQLERKDNQLETKDRLIDYRGEEIAKSHIDIINLTTECDEKDQEIHKLEEELDETHEVCCDITHHADYETTFDDIRLLEEKETETYKEIRELKGEIEMLKDRSQEAMKLTMSQNDRFMDQLESRDTFIQVQKEEIRKSYIENKNLTEEISKKLESDKYQVHHINCYLDYNGKYLECPDKEFIDEYTDDEKLRKDLYEDFNITDDEEEEEEDDELCICDNCSETYHPDNPFFIFEKEGVVDSQSFCQSCGDDLKDEMKKDGWIRDDDAEQEYWDNQKEISTICKDLVNTLIDNAIATMP